MLFCSTEAEDEMPRLDILSMTVLVKYMSLRPHVQRKRSSKHEATLAPLISGIDRKKCKQNHILMCLGDQ